MGIKEIRGWWARGDHLSRMLPATPVTSFTKEVNPWLAKRPLGSDGHLANRGLTSLIKEATDVVNGQCISLAA